MRLVSFVSFVSLTVASATIAACSGGDNTRQSQAAAAPADGGTKAPDKLASGKLGSIGSKTGDATKDAGAKPEPKPNPTPANKTCGEAAVCASECPDEGGDACVETCLADLPEAEVAKLQAVAACINASECADDECIQTTCGTEIQACIGG